MAEFLIRVLKWLAALVTAYFLLFILAILVLFGVAALFQPVPAEVKDNSILVLDLGFNLTDQPRSDDPSELLRQAMQGEVLETAALREVLETINDASLDPKIRGLLVTGNLIVDGYGSSFASLRELRRALITFADSKPVWAYLDGDSLRDYYLKSAASEVITNSQAMVDFRGLQAERLYLGDAFERIGVEVQTESFEEFKSAAEAYYRGDMSDAEREQLASLLDDLWRVLVADIASTRGLDPIALDTIAGREMILYGDEVHASGMADRQMQRDELIEYLAGLSAYDADGESFVQVDFLDYMEANTPMVPSMHLVGGGNKLAVIYAEGILLDGEGSEMSIGSESLGRYLREARNDESVKAVVLRVNSPGGSATAGFKAVREIQLTNERKPVVVSMGGIAASGGYMMAVAGDYIFAEPTTITGSIGVVSMLPNIEGLSEKLSLNFEEVKTHPFAGAYSLARRKTPEEMRQVREFGAHVYDDFLELVSQGREMPVDTVRQHARGRVWSGLAAMERGLVDEVGGLSAAIRYAADLAGIGDNFTIIERPQRKSLEEKLSELFLSSNATARPGRGDSLWSKWRELEAEVKILSQLNDPNGLYAILPYSLKIR